MGKKFLWKKECCLTNLWDIIRWSVIRQLAFVVRACRPPLLLFLVLGLLPLTCCTIGCSGGCGGCVLLSCFIMAVSGCSRPPHSLQGTKVPPNVTTTHVNNVWW